MTNKQETIEEKIRNMLRARCTSILLDKTTRNEGYVILSESVEDFINEIKSLLESEINRQREEMVEQLENQTIDPNFSDQIKQGFSTGISRAIGIIKGRSVWKSQNLNIAEKINQAKEEVLKEFRNVVDDYEKTKLRERASGLQMAYKIVKDSTPQREEEESI